MPTLAQRSRPMIRLFLVGISAASLAACASKPKPMPLAPPAPPQAPPAQRRAPPPPPPVSQRTTPPPTTGAPVPGSEKDFQVNAGDRVYFDYDQSDIRADARPVLDAQANWLKKYPAVTVRVDGNADERGTEEYNFALGARRASSVKDYLVGKGVAAGRIETVSYGKSRPVDPRPNEQGWAVNRNGHTAITGGAR